jgi:hypothetical protein
VSFGPQAATPLINSIGFCRVHLSGHLAGKDAFGSEGDDYADVIAPGFLQDPEARRRLNGSSKARRAERVPLPSGEPDDRTAACV